MYRSRGTETALFLGEFSLGLAMVAEAVGVFFQGTLPVCETRATPLQVCIIVVVVVAAAGAIFLLVLASLH